MKQGRLNMLKEIQCSFFNDEKIKFHQGLNIILGDDDAKNSIGKSTALMVIDFVFGGTSFTSDDAGVIKALGHHNYDYYFEFSGKNYYFSRSTQNADIVSICDKDYNKLEELSLGGYHEKLKELYGLKNLQSTFRSIVGSFARIWKKGELDPDHPFMASIKEQSGVPIGRLIDIFERSNEISAEKKVIDACKERKKLISKSMDAEIIPKINKTQYIKNEVLIDENTIQLEKQKLSLAETLNVYEALFDEQLRQMQQRKNTLVEERSDVLNKIKRLEKEVLGVTTRVSANIALVKEFFPNVNVERLEQVESFHQKIGNSVKKELKLELGLSQSKESELSAEIQLLSQQINMALKSKGMPTDVFKKLFDLQRAIDKAIEENKFFSEKEQLNDAIRVASERLGNVYSCIFRDIEEKTNLKLKNFNRVVYSLKRSSPILKINNISSYDFSSPNDAGTGKSYVGLIGFDLAMLSLTKVPFVIHDSIVYKNIEVTATQRIFRIVSAIKSKQIFLSFDESKKFGSQVEEIIKKSTVIKLSHNHLLYNQDWRDEAE